MSGLASWRRDVLVALPAWIEARIYVAVAFVVTRGLIDKLEPPPAFSPVDDWLVAWDGRWYVDIAEQGYHGGSDPGVRFFPLWPLLGRVFGWVVGRPDVALVVGANLLALVAAVLLHRLVIDETGSTTTARRAVRLFALFPPAFVLVLAYSEALYLTLAIGFVLLLRRGRFAPAAGVAFLAGLTRPVAGLLAFPAAVVGWQRGRLRRADAWAAIVAAPLGSVTFLVFSGLALDDWTAPLDRQRELRGDFTEPTTRWIRAVRDGVGGDAGELLHAVAIVAVLVLTVVVVRRLSLDLVAYTIPSVVLLVAADNLNSLERYALAVFPLIVAAAVISEREAVNRYLPTGCAVGLVSLTILSLNGVFVP